MYNKVICYLYFIRITYMVNIIFLDQLVELKRKKIKIYIKLLKLLLVLKNAK